VNSPQSQGVQNKHCSLPSSLYGRIRIVLLRSICRPYQSVSRSMDPRSVARPAEVHWTHAAAAPRLAPGIDDGAAAGRSAGSQLPGWRPPGVGRSVGRSCATLDICPLYVQSVSAPRTATNYDSCPPSPGHLAPHLNLTLNPNCRLNVTLNPNNNVNVTLTLPLLTQP